MKCMHCKHFVELEASNAENNAAAEFWYDTKLKPSSPHFSPTQSLWTTKVKRCSDTSSTDLQRDLRILCYNWFGFDFYSTGHTDSLGNLQVHSSSILTAKREAVASPYFLFKSLR